MSLRCSLCLERVVINRQSSTHFIFEHLPVGTARQVHNVIFPDRLFYASRLTVLEPIRSLSVAQPFLQCASQLSDTTDDFQVYNDDGSTAST